MWSSVKGYKQNPMLDTLKGSWELNVKRTYATYDFIFSIVTESARARSCYCVQ